MSAITLDQLNNNISDIQKLLLSRIWSYYLENNCWIKTKILHHEFGKNEVIMELISLSGSIVYENQDRYGLTLKGALLADETNEGLSLLVNYVYYLKERFLIDPEVEVITSQDIERDFNLNPFQSKLMRNYVQLSRFQNGYSGNKSNWQINVPSEIDDLPNIANLQSYVLDKIMEFYDPHYPVFEKDRFSYLAVPLRENDMFSFIDDQAYKNVITKDWEEIQSNLISEAWKSCVILCGSVLEASLIWILSKNEETILQSNIKINNQVVKKIDNMNLVELVTIAGKMGMIGKTTINLSHVIRDYRNLVHPKKQIMENMIVTKDEANIAFNSVKVIIKELNQFNNN
ncbi:hypothetical protein [Fusibacter bizertensis]